MSAADVPRAPADRLALVTGAAGGIGSAVVEQLTRDGLRVVATDLAVPDVPSAWARLALDVTDEEAWARVVGDVAVELGEVTVLVNAAGILRGSELEATSLAEWEHVLAVNTTGVFLGMRAVAAGMRRAGGGAIVNLSSIAGLVGYPRSLAYVASKWAVTGMSRAAALELAGDGVRVNSVHPGATDTAMARGVDPTSLPLARLGTPGEVADLVAFLVSGRAGYCTGSEFVIDGGRTAGSRR